MARRKRSHRRSRRRNAPRRHRRRAVASVRRRRRSNPRRSHRRIRARGRRRNPPRLLRGLGGRGILGNVVSGFVDAGWLLAGEAGTNVVSGFIPLDKTGPMGAVVKVASAVAVAWLAKRISPNASKMALAGGLASVIRGPVKNANLPLISANLGDIYNEGQYAVGAGAYPLLPGVSAYPQGVGDTDDEASFVQY